MNDLWQQKAACLGEPLSTFFPENNRGNDIPPPPKICVDCPVRQDCFDTALNDPSVVGYWGGEYFAITRKPELKSPRVPVDPSVKIFKVLQMLADGLTRPEIQEQMGLSSKAVSNQVVDAGKILGTSGMYETILEAAKVGKVVCDLVGCRELHDVESRFVDHLLEGGTIPRFRELNGLNVREMKDIQKRVLMVYKASRWEQVMAAVGVERGRVCV